MRQRPSENARGLEAAGQAERGREAAEPHEIPARGWRDILLRVKDDLVQDNLSIVAAGVAFYALLAIFPAVAALISLYGIVFNPQQLANQLAQFGAILPKESMDILLNQLREIAQAGSSKLSAAAIGSLLLTLWSAASGVKTLMEALNVAYKEEEHRGFFKLNAVALLLTIGGIILAVIAIACVVAVPAAVNLIGATGPTQKILLLARWPLLVIAVMISLSVMYRFGPSRRDARWQWVSWGAVIATLLWLAGSLLFSYYATHFGNYNKTYGSVGAVAILMTWFLLTAYATLIGAEINAEMERQTRRDTTVDGHKPLGRRRAYAADTVGRSP